MKVHATKALLGVVTKASSDYRKYRQMNGKKRRSTRLYGDDMLPEVFLTGFQLVIYYKDGLTMPPKPPHVDFGHRYPCWCTYSGSHHNIYPRNAIAYQQRDNGLRSRFSATNYRCTRFRLYHMQPSDTYIVTLDWLIGFS